MSWLRHLKLFNNLAKSCWVMKSQSPPSCIIFCFPHFPHEQRVSQDTLKCIHYRLDYNGKEVGESTCTMEISKRYKPTFPLPSARAQKAGG